VFFPKERRFSIAEDARQRVPPHARKKGARLPSDTGTQFEETYEGELPREDLTLSLDP